MATTSSTRTTRRSSSGGAGGNNAVSAGVNPPVTGSTTTTSFIVDDGHNVPPFPELLHKMISVESKQIGSPIHWVMDGDAFMVENVQPKLNTVLLKYFNHGRWTSLQRQLNLYNFKRHQNGSKHEGAFQHPMFHRDNTKEDLTKIKRKPRPKPGATNSNSNTNTTMKQQSPPQKQPQPQPQPLPQPQPTTSKPQPQKLGTRKRKVRRQNSEAASESSTLVREATGTVVAEQEGMTGGNKNSSTAEDCDGSDISTVANEDEDADNSSVMVKGQRPRQRHPKRQRKRTSSHATVSAPAPSKKTSKNKQEKQKQQQQPRVNLFHERKQQKQQQHLKQQQVQQQQRFPEQDPQPPPPKSTKKIILPYSLKKIMMDTWEAMLHEGLIPYVPVPAAITVRHVLGLYVEAKVEFVAARSGTYAADKQKVGWQDMADGIALFFDKAIATRLLCKKELPQFRQFQQQKRPCDIYGCEHLLRLLLRLPDILKECVPDEGTRQQIMQDMAEFVRFLHQHQDVLFQPIFCSKMAVVVVDEQRRQQQQKMDTARVTTSTAAIASDSAGKEVDNHGNNGVEAENRSSRVQEYNIAPSDDKTNSEVCHGNKGNKSSDDIEVGDNEDDKMEDVEREMDNSNNKTSSPGSRTGGESNSNQNTSHDIKMQGAVASENDSSGNGSNDISKSKTENAGVSNDGDQTSASGKKRKRR